MDNTRDINSIRSIDVFLREKLTRLCLEDIRKLTRIEIPIRIMCYSPSPETEDLEFIKSALAAGVLVKFLNKVPFASIEFIVVTFEMETQRKIYVLDNEEKFSLDLSLHTSLEATNRLSIGTDLDGYSIQTLMHELFELGWDIASPAVVLEPRLSPQSQNSHFLSYLRRIPQYRKLSPSDLIVKSIDLNNIYSSTNYVKKDSLYRVDHICQAFANQNLQMFETCYCWLSGKDFLLLPPIVEAHDARHVIVDGTHRLYQALFKYNQNEALCLVLHNTPKLPGNPTAFSSVRERINRIPRELAFSDYDESLFRRFILMERELIGIRSTLPD